jgi:enoyl-[acyl-carrier protein] reductase II
MLLSPYLGGIMDILLEEKVAVVTTGAGNPGKYVPALREAGTKVIPVVSSVALAKRLTRSGVDAFIAEGTESGGHIGDLTTMALVPQVVDAVDLPVIAAGGVYDGRGLVAALALGAVGVQMGTRFMCAEECTIPRKVKEFVIKAKDRDTAVSGISTATRYVLSAISLPGNMKRWRETTLRWKKLKNWGWESLRLAMVEGDIENGTVMAGQVSAMVKKYSPPVKLFWIL